MALLIDSSSVTDPAQRLAEVTGEKKHLLGACRAGDGSVHLAICRPDAEITGKLMHQFLDSQAALA